MQMFLATAIAVVTHSLFFLAGLIVAGHYHDKLDIERDKAEADKRYELQSQFVRLKARCDADDPCRPYVSRLQPVPATGDYDGDKDLKPISDEFMKNLKENGSAVVKLKKADIAK